MSSISTRPSRRWKRSIGAAVVAAALCFATTACQPTAPSISWRLGATHGVVYESGASRASMNVFRSPRNALMEVWKVGGINLVQDAMWHFGQPPRFAACAYGVCLDTDFVAGAISGWIYGDDWDLKGALFDAQNNRDCLALTLISHGAYIKNWTHKGVGCSLGSLPTGTREAPSPAELGLEQTTVAGAEALDPSDWRPGMPEPGPAEPTPPAP